MHCKFYTPAKYTTFSNGMLPCKCGDSRDDIGQICEYTQCWFYQKRAHPHLPDAEIIRINTECGYMPHNAPGKTGEPLKQN